MLPVPAAPVPDPAAPAPDPAPVPAPVCSDATITSPLLWMSDVGPFGEDGAVGDSGDGDALVQWSETLVALVTLNCFVALLFAVAVPVFELEFIPEFAPADASPLVPALAPACVPELVLALAEAEPVLSDGVPVN